MNQKAVAREWLLFVGLVGGAIVFLPLLAVLFFSPGDSTAGDVLELYGALLPELLGPEWWIAWLFALVPYALVQLIRSVMWAVRIGWK